MTKKIILIIGIVATIIIACYLNYKLCCSKSSCAAKTEVSFVKNDSLNTIKQKFTTNGFNIEDNKSGLKFYSNSNFNFFKSQYNIADPLNEKTNFEISRLSEYLRNNPTKNVTIIGQYTSTDTNNSIYPDLGIARANAVKNYLVSYGTPIKSLHLSSELNKNIKPDSVNKYYGPVNFLIYLKKENNKTNHSLAKDSLNSQPLTLYFNTGLTSLNLSKPQRKKILELITFIEENNNQLIVTGHTDNNGERQKNINLALERASFVKTELIKNGILDKYIKIESKGPDFPIAPNNTEEGKAKNRRVEITIN